MSLVFHSVESQDGSVPCVGIMAWQLIKEREEERENTCLRDRADFSEEGTVGHTGGQEPVRLGGGALLNPNINLNLGASNTDP